MPPTTRLQTHPERRVDYYAKPSRAKQKQQQTQDCLICTKTKTVIGSFKAPRDSCEHFRAICKICIAEMLKSKVSDRKLKDVELSCPFYDMKCTHSLDLNALRKVVPRAAFRTYDIAITKYLLSTIKSYIHCISISCGLSFSIEDPEGNKILKDWVECPYCDFKFYVKCHRPWNEHRRGNCNQIKKNKDRKSVALIRAIGAKPCPRCGLNIEKDNGRNHMICAACSHHFCWKCRGSYDGIYACPCARAALEAAPINQKGSRIQRDEFL